MAFTGIVGRQTTNDKDHTEVPTTVAATYTRIAWHFTCHNSSTACDTVPGTTCCCRDSTTVAAASPLPLEYQPFHLAVTDSATVDELRYHCDLTT